MLKLHITPSSYKPFTTFTCFEFYQLAVLVDYVQHLIAAERRKDFTTRPEKHFDGLFECMCLTCFRKSLFLTPPSPHHHRSRIRSSLLFWLSCFICHRNEKASLESQLTNLQKEMENLKQQVDERVSFNCNPSLLNLFALLRGFGS